MAESAVKTAESLLKKALSSDSDPYLAILDYRNPPHQQMAASPAQLLTAQRTKTTLPTTKALLKLKVVDCKKQREAKVRRTKWYYNRYAKDLPLLQRGDNVSVQPLRIQDKWCKGTVTQQLGTRSYEVEVERNRLRHNRLHLKQIPKSSFSETSQQTHDGSQGNPLARDTSMQHAEDITPSHVDSTPSHVNKAPATTNGRPSRNKRSPSHFKDCVMYYSLRL